MYEYASAGVGFRKFYFALGLNPFGEEDDNSGPANGDELVTSIVRKLFHLGMSQNVPRGAPGRLPATYGSPASARDSGKQLCTLKRQRNDYRRKKLLWWNDVRQLTKRRGPCSSNETRSTRRQEYSSDVLRTEPLPNERDWLVPIVIT